MAHFRSGTFERSRAVPIRTEKWPRQSPHQYGSGFPFGVGLTRVLSAAAGADGAGRPDYGLNPKPGGFLVGEHLEKFGERDSVSVGASRTRLAHTEYSAISL